MIMKMEDLKQTAESRRDNGETFPILGWGDDVRPSFPEGFGHGYWCGAIISYYLKDWLTGDEVKGLLDDLRTKIKPIESEDFEKSVEAIHELVKVQGK